MVDWEYLCKEGFVCVLKNMPTMPYVPVLPEGGIRGCGRRGFKSIGGAELESKDHNGLQRVQAEKLQYQEEQEE